MKGHGKQDENNSMTSKSGPGKFVTSKVRVAHNSLSQVVKVKPLFQYSQQYLTRESRDHKKYNSFHSWQASNMAAAGGPPGPNATVGSGAGLSTFDSAKALMSDKDIELELDRIFQTLQVLKERGSAAPDNNAGMALKIAAIQEALKTASTEGGGTCTMVTPMAAPGCTTSSPPKVTSQSHQKNSVQILNGQVVNCQSTTPLIPVNNQSLPKVLPQKNTKTFRKFLSFLLYH